MSAVVLSFFAGTLSVLSPCVLPLAPVVMASAFQRHPRGPLALAAGLVLASAGTGLVFASLGFAAGVDRDVVRAAAGAVMAVVGVALLVPGLQDVFARLVAPVAHAAGALSARVPAGLLGQFVLGALLGAAWTPCTGPTLAAAVGLAARSDGIARAGVVMLVFGVGAALPLLLFGYGSRRALAARGRALATIATVAKPAMGGVLLAIGALTSTGADKAVEAWMVDRMPDWLLDLTTRF
jgi:cytochrome c-type biogenesis protein